MSTPPPPRRLQVLTVCSYNRTRSVMAAALLDTQLRDLLGPDAVTVTSTGFGVPGRPALPDAVGAMRRRGLDVSQHRSSTITPASVEQADLILTAERDHVVKVAALAPVGFARTFTLPEFAALAAGVGAAATSGGHDARPAALTERVAAWVEQLGHARRAAAYLQSPIAEIADPTGSSRRAFEAAVAAIERHCRDVAAALAGIADGASGASGADGANGV